VSLGQSVSASTFFSATDNPDNPITWYQVTNTGGGGGYFTLNGQEQTPGQTFYVSADQLSDLAYVGGNTSGVADSIQVSAFDGAIWSPAATFDVVAANSWEATGIDQLVTGNPNSPATLAGGFSGDTLVGGSGQDTFVYGAGSGPEFISETAPTASASDNILQFGSGITPGSITLSEAPGGVLTLTTGSNGDSVSIEGFDPANPLGSAGIQQFQFSDGTDLSFSQLLAQANESAGSFENADGTFTNYSFSPGGPALYIDDTVNTIGQITEDYNLDNDGSTVVTTFTYGDNGISLGDGFQNVTGFSENVTNPDGSTDDNTVSFNPDGSFTDTEVATAAGASASTTTIDNFGASGNMLSEDITNPDGSTEDSTFTYNGDGSYVETTVSTAAGAALSTTEVQQFNAEGQLVNQNIYTPSADGSYTDSWSKSDGSSGTYWWNSSTLEYQETWNNADGSSFTDTYQFAPGGSPGANGFSFTETYSDSSGDAGSRTYDATTGVTTVSWDSAQTGAISGTSPNDSGFIGLQLQGEVTNSINDPAYFNPLVSPAFNAFLTAHG
jgi:hypothetical protein